MITEPLSAMPPAGAGWAAWCARAREVARPVQGQAPVKTGHDAQDTSQKQENRYAGAGF